MTLVANGVVPQHFSFRPQSAPPENRVHCNSPSQAHKTTDNAVHYGSAGGKQYQNYYTISHIFFLVPSKEHIQFGQKSTSIGLNLNKRINN